MSSCSSLGERDPTFRLAGSQVWAVTALHLDRLEPARQRLETAVSLADELADPALAALVGQDFRVMSRAFLGWTLSLLAEQDRGAELAAEAVAIAHQRAHPPDLAFALAIEALCAAIRRDAVTARRAAEEGLRLASEHGFPMFAAMHAMHRGWARAEEGEPGEGIADLLAGLAAFDATGARMLRSWFLMLLARAYRLAGHHDDARAVVDEALAQATRCWDRELEELRGELASA